MTFESFISDYALPGSYILLGVCVLGVVLFPIIQSFSNPKQLVKPLVGLLVVGLLYIIGFQLADSTPSDALYPLIESFPKLNTMDAEVAASTVTRNVGAAFFVTYVLGALMVVGIFFTELSKYFR